MLAQYIPLLAHTDKYWASSYGQNTGSTFSVKQLNIDTCGLLLLMMLGVHFRNNFKYKSLGNSN